MFYREFLFGEMPERQGMQRQETAEGQWVQCQRTAEDRKVQQFTVVRVSAHDLYEPGVGYGFVVERNRREQELLRFPELNSAFDTVYWYRDEDLTHLQEDERGCFLDSETEMRHLQEQAGAAFEGEHRRIPLSFKADVPHQGNYRVTVAVDAPEPVEDVLIFTGRRRLAYRGCVQNCANESACGEVILAEDKAVQNLSMEESGKRVSEPVCGEAIFADDKAMQNLSVGEAGKRSTSRMWEAAFTVNVCDIIPRGQGRVYEDKSIDITVVADKPRVSRVTVEEVDCPTLFIAGDSTVTDQSADYPYAPGTSYSGWGQMLSAYLNGDIAVSNHAHSGLTTASFRNEGHYGIVEKYIRPGDYLFIQFAHNDQKLDFLKAEEGYKQNLVRYIRECRERGAFPVLVTPLARNTWKGNDGSYNDLLEEYADVCIRVGEEENVPVVDLHGRSMDFIVKTGLEASKSRFFPGDYTHSNDYGAYFMAGLVAEEVVKSCSRREEPEYRFLAECVTKRFGAWEPAPHIVMPVKPAIYENIENPEDADVLAGVTNLGEPADRASALDMVIKTARFFPTNVYNDMFSDVVGHEWYAGAVECAYQNGMIDPGLVEDGKFYPLQPVTLEEFLVFAVNGYRSRRTLPEVGENAPERICIYDGACRTFAKPYVRAACALGLIAADGSEALGRVLTRGEAVEICRKLGI